MAVGLWLAVAGYGGRLSDNVSPSAGGGPPLTYTPQRLFIREMAGRSVCVCVCVLVCVCVPYV